MRVTLSLQMRLLHAQLSGAKAAAEKQFATHQKQQQHLKKEEEQQRHQKHLKEEKQRHQQ